MRVTVDEYSYGFVKLALLRNLVMTPAELDKLKVFSDLAGLIEYIKPYYPGFNPQKRAVLTIEQDLWEIYIKFLEKIIVSSPSSIQIFVKSLLVRFEIWNLKTIILSIIANIPSEVREKEIYIRASEILEHSEMLKRLIRAKSLDEVNKIVRHSPYEKIIENGLAKYQQTHEIFYLEQDLDQYYYRNLINSLDFYPKQERNIVEQYIRYILDFYNLNLLYRSLFNNMPISQVIPYLIPNGYYLKYDEIHELSLCNDLIQFTQVLSRIFKGNRKLEKIIAEFNSKSLNAWENMQRLFLSSFNIQLQQSIVGNIPLTTMMQIFNLTVNKEFEIREIVGRATKIAYQNPEDDKK